MWITRLNEWLRYKSARGRVILTDVSVMSHCMRSSRVGQWKTDGKMDRQALLDTQTGSRPNQNPVLVEEEALPVCQLACPFVCLFPLPSPGTPHAITDKTQQSELRDRKRDRESMGGETRREGEREKKRVGGGRGKIGRYRKSNYLCTDRLRSI